MLRRLKSHIIFIFTWLKSYVDQMLTLKIFCNRLRINSYRQTEITFGRVFMLRRLKNLLISFSKVEMHCSLIWVRKVKSDDSSTLFCFSVCKVHIFWEGHKILQNLWRFCKILCLSKNIWTLIKKIPITVPERAPDKDARPILGRHYHPTIIELACLFLIVKKIVKKTFLSKTSILLRVISILRSSTHPISVPTYVAFYLKY